MRALAIDATSLDQSALLSDWTWLVPSDHQLLLVGAFGDCILGDASGAHWNLSLLEGVYERVCNGSGEFNQLKQDPANLQHWFNAEWVDLAFQSGKVPTNDECLGWQVHPILGAPFSVENISVFSLNVYLSLMGQLFGQLREQND